MKDLIELRNKKLLAEQEYSQAACSLDGSLQLILKKEELRIARFEYNAACVTHIEELYFEPDGA